MTFRPKLEAHMQTREKGQTMYSLTLKGDQWWLINFIENNSGEIEKDRIR